VAPAPLGLTIGGKQGLQAQLLERDVEGRTDRGDHGDEPQLTRRSVEHQRHHQVVPRRQRWPVGEVDHAGIGPGLGHQSSEALVERALDRLTLESVHQDRGESLPLDDGRAKALGMQTQAHGIEPDVERNVDPRQGRELHAGGVGQHEVPAAIHDVGRNGAVGIDHRLEDVAHVVEVGIVEGSLCVLGGVAGGGEQRVLVAQRKFERASQVQHHLAARSATTRLEEGEMALGDLGCRRERQLGVAAGISPAAKLLAERDDRGRRSWCRTVGHRVGHGSTLRRRG